MVEPDIETLKRQATLAYGFWFAAIIEYVIFGHASSEPSINNGLIVICIVMALIGGVRMVRKNSRIRDHKRKVNVTLSDILITLLLLALVYLIPNFLGLVKAGIILVIAAIYIRQYLRSLEKLRL
ncbi:hypothetical protein KDA_23760 [Dictyobacter alpinus]|uniref:Uncharacterized protein n=1 Tax=Dictyobacter alpinus TaxID=2014873 RepID=A0A402B6C1_9CHLR|nr:hypothetical protein [Dictyobacter alpinus]GCE26892.1 hypothetical protein KDA_23760 [Dictyobacter alpinus]